jgi:hypothetical protein
LYPIIEYSLHGHLLFVKNRGWLFYYNSHGISLPINNFPAYNIFDRRLVPMFIQEDNMNISALMEEFQLEIDDIRWYLSTGMAERLLTYRDNPEELVQLIWSGKLGDDLYNMEEQYLSSLEDEHSRGLLDEVQIRNFFHEALAEKRKRYQTDKSY